MNSELSLLHGAKVVSVEKHWGSLEVRFLDGRILRVRGGEECSLEVKVIGE